MTKRDPLFWRRASAIRAKEWAQIWLDPSTFGLVVLMPLILMFLFGSAVTLDVRGTRTGVIDLDRTQASRDLVATLAANDYFRISEQPSVVEAKPALLSGALRGFVVIPDGFERDLAAGQVPSLQLVSDGTQVNTATLLAANLRGTLRNWTEARARARPVAPTTAKRDRPLYIQSGTGEPLHARARSDRHRYGNDRQPADCADHGARV